jgi:hypothetical protein
MSQEKDRLLARKARIEARLAAIDQAESKKREKDDRRKADLAGRAVLTRARKDKAFAARLREVLDAEIAGARNRALFDLPAKADGHDRTQAAREAGAAANKDAPSPPASVATPAP